MFQCWSSLPCQRNPVHCRARSLLCISLPSRWQGRYRCCQSNPLKPTSLFVAEGELETFPEMWLSCCLLGNAVLCEWQMQGNVEIATLESCHWVSAGYRVLNNNAVFCMFVPIFLLSIPSLSFSPLILSLPFLFYTPGIWKRLEWLSWDRRRRSWAASKQ